MQISARIQGWITAPYSQVVAKAFLRGYSCAAFAVLAPVLPMNHFDVGATLSALGACIRNRAFLYLFFDSALGAGLASAWSELRPGAYDFLYSFLQNPNASTAGQESKTS